MMNQISASAALELLRRGEPVRDAQVSEPIHLRELCAENDLLVQLQFLGCHLHALDAPSVYFHKPVVLRDTTVEKSCFFAGYFFEGLTIERCRFIGPVDFECGGHNRAGCSIVLRDTTFEQFVDFLDCWYEGPVEIIGCRFRRGANLLGNKGRPFEVRFDVPPVLQQNEGSLDLDGG